MISPVNKKVNAGEGPRIIPVQLLLDLILFVNQLCFTYENGHRSRT